MKSLYESDFHAWCLKQASLLKSEQPLSPIDTTYIAEEIEEMGNEKLFSLSSHLTSLIMHLLKWKFQENKRTESWLISIGNARDSIEWLLRKNPSLSSKLENEIIESYAMAVRKAARETKLSPEAFPKVNPFPYPEFLSEGWFPE